VTFWAWVLLLLAAAIALGVAAGRLTRSKGVGVTAAILSALAGAVHGLHGLILAFGESGDTRSGYDQFVADRWLLLLVVYMAAPPLLLVAISWLSGRGRSTS
jgi:hypothetical protein